MTDMTAFIQDPTASNVVTPTYTACTATDKFLAGQGSRYMLHYKNGATPTAGAIYVSEKQAQAPAGALPLVNGVPSTKWSDLQVIPIGGIAATTEKVVVIDNITPYIDSLGFVNLLHGGTLTTLTVAILGPLS